MEELEEGYDELEVLIDSFIFGEKIQDGAFKDAIIDSLIASVSTLGKEGKYWYPTGKMIDRAYKGTPTGSPLRRLLVDMHVNHGQRFWIEEGMNADFLADLVRNLLDIRDLVHEWDPTRPDISSCPYHHHGDDSQCYSIQAQQE